MDHHRDDASEQPRRHRASPCRAAVSGQRPGPTSPSTNRARQFGILPPLLIILFLASAVASDPEAAAPVSRKKIRAAIARAETWLAREQESDGSWPMRIQSSTKDLTALCTYALMTSHSPRIEKAAERGRIWIRQEFKPAESGAAGSTKGRASRMKLMSSAMHQTYGLVLICRALMQFKEPDTCPLGTGDLVLRSKGDATRIRRFSKWLARSIVPLQGQPTGWAYGVSTDMIQSQVVGVAPTGDISNTSYATWALSSLSDCGYAVEEPLWSKTLKSILFFREAEGGYFYNGQEPREVTTRRTLLALSALQACAAHLTGTTRVAAKRAESEAWSWLDDHLHLRTEWKQHPGSTHTYVGLVELARVCHRARRKTIGQQHWYEEGARALLRYQNKSGAWGIGGGSGTPETALAILFLKSPPDWSSPTPLQSSDAR